MFVSVSVSRAEEVLITGKKLDYVCVCKWRVMRSDVITVQAYHLSIITTLPV